MCTRRRPGTRNALVLDVALGALARRRRRGGARAVAPRGCSTTRRGLRARAARHADAFRSRARPRTSRAGSRSLPTSRTSPAPRSGSADSSRCSCRPARSTAKLAQTQHGASRPRRSRRCPCSQHGGLLRARDRAHGRAPGLDDVLRPRAARQDRDLPAAARARLAQPHARRALRRACARRSCCSPSCRRGRRARPAQARRRRDARARGAARRSAAARPPAARTRSSTARELGPLAVGVARGRGDDRDAARLRRHRRRTVGRSPSNGTSATPCGAGCYRAPASSGPLRVTVDGDALTFADSPRCARRDHAARARDAAYHRLEHDRVRRGARARTYRRHAIDALHRQGSRRARLRHPRRRAGGRARRAPLGPRHTERQVGAVGADAAAGHAAVLARPDERAPRRPEHAHVPRPTHPCLVPRHDRQAGSPGADAHDRGRALHGRPLPSATACR